MIRALFALCGGAGLLYHYRRLIASGRGGKGGGSLACLLVIGVVLILASQPWNEKRLNDAHEEVEAFSREILGWGLFVMTAFLLWFAGLGWDGPW